MRKNNLTEQLFIVCGLALGVIIILLWLILPNMLLPVCEENLYNYLKQPLNFFQNKEDIVSNKINTEVAFIYIDSSNNVSISDNLLELINIKKIDYLLSKLELNKNKGKIKINHKTYYYVTSINSDKIKIAITGDSYVSKFRKSIFVVLLEVVIVPFSLISLFILAWSNNLVNRIKKIKGKIDNINNEDYNHEPDTKYTDELYILDKAVMDMHIYLKEQEEYKNQMYQNISHDFKTPITVMKSYIEACEDGIQTKDETLNIISEQLDKLEFKVHSLLYLNKLNYFKDKLDNLNEQYDVSITINSAVDKFKMSRPDVKFVLDIDKKSTIFRGSADMWEAIIDNILNNFMRYAKKKVKITVKNHKITLYNDGENIDENVLTNIFTPYEKGVKGVFGLGLSIVKKTLHFLSYDITIENVKNGVKFIIYENKNLGS